MKRNRIKGIKYNRISQQQKYILIHSIIKQHCTIHQAAIKARMNYSTAKATYFFYKKDQKSYFNNMIIDDTQKKENILKEAGYIDKKSVDHNFSYKPISIISTLIGQDQSQNQVQNSQIDNKCQFKTTIQRN